VNNLLVVNLVEFVCAGTSHLASGLEFLNGVTFLGVDRYLSDISVTDGKIIEGKLNELFHSWSQPGRFRSSADITSQVVRRPHSAVAL
jgi:hypothetical protein